MELPARQRIQPGGRLIEKHQFRPADESDRHIQAAALAAGQHPDLLVGMGGQTHRRQQLVGAPRPVDRLGGVTAIVGTELLEEFPNPPLAVVPPRLQHYPQSRAPPFGAVRRIDTEHLDPAAGPHPEPL